jgi:hypothetical protein
MGKFQNKAQYFKFAVYRVLRVNEVAKLYLFMLNINTVKEKNKNNAQNRAYKSLESKKRIEQQVNLKLLTCYCTKFNELVLLIQIR